MKTTQTLAVSMALGSLSSMAQSFDHLDANMIRARFTAHGMIGLDRSVGEPDFEVPVGSGAHALFAASMWVGGYDTLGSLHLAGLLFDQNGLPDYAPGPLTTDGSASITPAVSAQYDQVFKVKAVDVALHQAYYDCLNTPGCDVNVQFPGYVIPQSFLDWPGNGDTLAGQAARLAPFIDLDGDGLYEPTAGDAPCIHGDEALYFMFNDVLNPHGTGGAPLGIEVHAMPFAFYSANEALAHTLFIKYRLINRSDDSFEMVRIGLFTDYDLGYGRDDYVGSDPGRNLGYVYNADTLDETTSTYTGYGSMPPAFGTTQLKGPFLEPDGFDDPEGPGIPAFNGSGFGDLVVDNERHGVAYMTYFSNDATARGNPNTAEQFFGYLSGYWRDGTPLFHGGTGHYSDPEATTVPARFAFPSSEDPLGAGTGGQVMAPWAEHSSGNQPRDRRMVMSAGPVELDAGEEIELVYAFVFARPGSNGLMSSVLRLQERVDSVQAFYNDLPEACNGAGSQVGLEEHTDRGPIVFPVPAEDRLTLRLEVPGPVELVVYDMLGVECSRGRDTGDLIQIDLSELGQGSYLLHVAQGEVSHVVPFMKITTR